MPRWEYIQIRSVYIQKEGVWNQILRLTGTDGIESELEGVLGTRDYSSIIGILNQLGGQGWELVAISPVEAGMFYEAATPGNTSYNRAVPMSKSYVFKRPKN